MNNAAKTSANIRLHNVRQELENGMLESRITKIEEPELEEQDKPGIA